jgi:hypothetical protein
MLDGTETPAGGDTVRFTVPWKPIVSVGATGRLGAAAGACLKLNAQERRIGGDAVGAGEAAKQVVERVVLDHDLDHVLDRVFVPLARAASVRVTCVGGVRVACAVAGSATAASAATPAPASSHAAVLTGLRRPELVGRGSGSCMMRPPG